MIADQQQLIDHGERLLAAAAQGGPATAARLCWSQAEGEALVLGFSQKPDIVNEAELERRPLPIYHRRAGGTVVLVGPHLLGLDVFLPAGHPLILADVVESYRWLGEAWVDALRLLGVETRAVSPTEAHAQHDLLKQEATRERETILRRACYGALSPYEVVAGQRKVVGLDMIRRKAGTLLQAGLLFPDLGPKARCKSFECWLAQTPPSALAVFAPPEATARALGMNGTETIGAVSLPAH